MKNIFSFAIITIVTIFFPLSIIAKNISSENISTSQFPFNSENPNNVTQQKKLAYKLYKDGHYLTALNLCKKLYRHDETGWCEGLIGNMYLLFLNGHGTKKNFIKTIQWDKLALTKNNPQPFIINILDNMTDAYFGLHDHVNAFNQALQAAKMGDPSAQIIVAVLYASGRGTIKDYIKAYAWLNVAMAVGNYHFNNFNNNDIEQLKFTIETKLTGNSTEQAQALAKKYYKLYVLHESPFDVLGNKIGAAINWLSGT